MKSLAIVGSYRKGKTVDTLVDRAIAGAESTPGVHVDKVMLIDKNIKYCTNCMVCRRDDTTKSHARCIIEDDMQSLYPKITEADVIVIASPIYWFTISAQTKLCIDRWYALESEEWSALRGKQLGIVLVYGDTDLYTSGGINAIHAFESLARYLGMEIAGMVYGTAWKLGEAEKQPELMEKAFKLGAKLAD